MMGKALSRIVFFIAAATLALGTPAFAQTISQTNVVGGSGGNAFQDSSIPANARVSEVIISAGSFIDAVQLVYVTPDGRTATSTLRGGSGGTRNTFRLGSDEYLIGISGRYGRNIDSLRLHTNKRTSPVYGGSGGANDFRIEIPSGNQVVGFIGRSGRLLDAIGLVYAPNFLQISGQTKIAGGSGGNGFMDTEIPWGARLTEIRVHAGKFIDGIQAVYTLPDGSLFEAPFHGGTGGDRTVFRLETNEYVTGISGRHGEYIDSLRIHTNKRTSPQYGRSGGRTDYRIDIPAGNQGVGLIGRSGRYLDAIGLSYTATTGQVRDFFRRRPTRERN